MWLFFRDDGLGRNPKEFARLVTLFARHDQKLNASAIPTLMSDEIIHASIPYSYQAAPFLQVVTHGFRHHNYENVGKQTEYGPSRNLEDVKAELEAGRKILSDRFENYFPCFVPPWNQMEERFLPLLSECGYLMLSRDEQAKTLAPLPEFDACLDLHFSEVKLTAKEIFRELARKNEAGQDCTGVTIHHGKMVDEDFDILDELLRELSKRSINTCFFSDLIPGNERLQNIDIVHI